MYSNITNNPSCIIPHCHPNNANNQFKVFILSDFKLYYIVLMTITWILGHHHTGWSSIITAFHHHKYYHCRTNTWYQQQYILQWIQHIQTLKPRHKIIDDPWPQTTKIQITGWIWQHCNNVGCRWLFTLISEAYTQYLLPTTTDLSCLGYRSSISQYEFFNTVILLCMRMLGKTICISKS